MNDNPTNQEQPLPRRTKSWKQHLTERLNTPREASAYLEAALEDYPQDQDPAFIGRVMQDICNAYKLPLDISLASSSAPVESERCVKCGHNANDKRRRGSDEYNSFCIYGCGCDCDFSRPLSPVTDAKDAEIEAASRPVSDAARRAAEKWFAETRAEIERRRRETGNSFADTAIVNLDAAVEKLAAIIEAELTKE